jgi:hypothetical protein
MDSFRELEVSAHGHTFCRLLRETEGRTPVLDAEGLGDFAVREPPGALKTILETAAALLPLATIAALDISGPSNAIRTAAGLALQTIRRAEGTDHLRALITSPLALETSGSSTPLADLRAIGPTPFRTVCRPTSTKQIATVTVFYAGLTYRPQAVRPRTPPHLRHSAHVTLKALENGLRAQTAIGRCLETSLASETVRKSTDIAKYAFVGTSFAQSFGTIAAS